MMVPAVSTDAVSMAHPPPRLAAAHAAVHTASAAAQADSCKPPSAFPRGGARRSNSRRLSHAWEGDDSAAGEGDRMRVRVSEDVLSFGARAVLDKRAPVEVRV